MKCYCAGTRHVARLLTRFYEDALRDSGLTPTQFELLATLTSRPGLSQSDLAGAVGSDQTTLSRNLKILTGRGWVLRSGSEEDSRRAVYTVGPAGQAVFETALPLWRGAQSRIEAGLGDEPEAVWAVLERLSAAASRDIV